VKYKLWWVLAFLLILGDAGITYWAVTGGHAQEANPTVKDAIEEYGLAVALAAGSVIRGLSLVLAMLVQQWLPRHKRTMPLIGVTVQAPPVVWNVWLLFF